MLVSSCIIGALTTEALLPTAQRIATICPVWRSCGGCPQSELSDLQRKQHHEHRVREAFTRAGLRIPLLKWIEAPSRSYYRNRVRLLVEAGAPVFFNANKAEHCSALSTELLRAVAEFTAWARVHRDELLSFRHAEVRAPDDMGVPALALRGNTGPPPRIKGPAGFLLWLEGERAAFQRFTLFDRCYTYIPVNGFMQVNHAVNRALVAQVVARTLAHGGARQTFADVFSGAGNFGLPLLAAGLSGVFVEQDSAARTGAIQALEEQQQPIPDWSVADGRQWLRTQAKAGARFDTVLVDPPRSGLRDAAPDAAAICETQLGLFSCNLSVSQGDLARLAQSRLELDAVWLVDMFPNTDHLEVVSWFVRR